MNTLAPLVKRPHTLSLARYSPHAEAPSWNSTPTLILAWVQGLEPGTIGGRQARGAL
jgi:hypothetical protein